MYSKENEGSCVGLKLIFLQYLQVGIIEINEYTIDTNMWE